MNTSLPGQRLREAREAAGLSVDEVARRLHLSNTFVRALEQDDYDRLPEPTFIKGYLRNYARLLGLPAEEVAAMFQRVLDEDSSEQADEPVRPLKTPMEGRRRQSWLVGAIAAAVVVLLVWLGAGVDEPDTVADALPPPAEEAEALSPVRDDPIADDTVDPAAAGTDSAEPAVAETTSQADALIQTPEVQVEPTPTVDRLTVTFNDDCWVRVQDAAGEEIHAGVEGAGSMLSLDGPAPFRLTLGNAAAVDTILVNGESVPVPQAAPGRVRTLRVP